MGAWNVEPSPGSHGLVGGIPDNFIGTQVPVGNRNPWQKQPLYTRYLYKPDETTEPVLYIKMAMANADSDWWIAAAPSPGAAFKIKKLPVTTLTNAEIDTGWDLPAKAVVYDVFVDVRTLEATAATKTIDVGLLSSESGGDTNGFLAGVSTATPAGVKTGGFTYTDGTNQNYVSATTMGVLLYDGLLGGDVAGTAGTVVRTPHIAGSLTARSVVYQLGSTHTELVADIYIVYAQLGL